MVDQIFRQFDLTCAMHAWTFYVRRRSRRTLVFGDRYHVQRELYASINKSSLRSRLALPVYRRVLTFAGRTGQHQKSASVYAISRHGQVTNDPFESSAAAESDLRSRRRTTSTIGAIMLLYLQIMPSVPPASCVGL